MLRVKVKTPIMGASVSYYASLHQLSRGKQKGLEHGTASEEKKKKHKDLSVGRLFSLPSASPSYSTSDEQVKPSLSGKPLLSGTNTYMHVLLIASSGQCPEQ